MFIFQKPIYTILPIQGVPLLYYEGRFLDLGACHLCYTDYTDKLIITFLCTLCICTHLCTLYICNGGVQPAFSPCNCGLIHTTNLPSIIVTIHLSKEFWKFRLIWVRELVKMHSVSAPSPDFQNECHVRLNQYLKAG